MSGSDAEDTRATDREQSERAHDQTERAHDQTESAHEQTERAHDQTAKPHEQTERVHEQTGRAHDQTERDHVIDPAAPEADVAPAPDVTAELDAARELDNAPERDVTPQGDDAPEPERPSELSFEIDTAIDAAPDDPEHLPGVLATRLADPADLLAAIEAILFVVESPVAVATLAASLEQTTDAVRGAIETLRAGYADRRAGIEVRDIAGGVRIFTRVEHADVVEQFLQEGQRSRLTQAALETLAVIAYRQPVTRARVSAIRGVNVDGVVRTLLARGLIVEVGTDAETGGGLFRTSEMFLEKMGLKSLDELPSLAPLLPDIEGLDDSFAGEDL